MQDLKVDAGESLPGCVENLSELPASPVRAFEELDTQLCDDVVAKLEDVPCEWGPICEVLAKFGDSLTGAVLDEVIRRSAEKLGFWSPDKALTRAARSAVQRRLRPAGRCSSASDDEALNDFAGDLAASHTGVVKEASYSVARQISKISTTQASGEQAVSPTKSLPKSPSKGWAKSPSKGQPTSPSSVLRQAADAAGFARQVTTESHHLKRGGSICFSQADFKAEVDEEIKAKTKEMTKSEALRITNPAASRLRQFKWALFFFVTFQMVLFALYVVFYMTPMTWDVIGLPILIARGSAYGACFWTGVLFLTMSRDLISFVTRLPFVKDSQLAMQLINCHKEIHIFSAWELLLDGCLHALMHHIGTFVALEREDTATLNRMLVCAQDKRTLPDGYIGKVMDNFLKALQFPACPLPEGAEVGYFDGVFSTPGITGYLLLAVIFVLGYYSRNKKRRANFRLFYALHHLLVPSWVVLLILHGANDWVGLGFPLVILVAGIPVAAYLWTRLRRAYLTLRHDAKVVGVQKSATGKLLRLEVELMPTYRACKVGEYAYINVQEVGRTEWHPYTISDAKLQPDGRQVITFCVMSVGKWTKKLHDLFGAAMQGGDDWPKVYVDGPFYAPTVSMPSRSTVVGIGAGVGVTPFLSFLGSLSGSSGATHRNAHVFWMSAFASDFMLFKDMFSALDRRAKTEPSGGSTTFHLHATPRFGAWNGKGLGSVFELAARDVWAGWEKRLLAKGAQVVPSFCHYGQPLHAVVSRNMLETDRPLAVAVGSPDWIIELLAIGEADPSEDVFVYFCGNDFLKNMVQGACITCNEVRMAAGKEQRYYFYFERFG